MKIEVDKKSEKKLKIQLILDECDAQPMDEFALVEQLQKLLKNNKTVSVCKLEQLLPHSKRFKINSKIGDFSKN